MKLLREKDLKDYIPVLKFPAVRVGKGEHEVIVYGLGEDAVTGEVCVICQNRAIYDNPELLKGDV